MTAVSELLAGKIENIALRLQLLQVQGNAMVAEQKALIEQARIEVGAPEGHAYNTDTRQFQSPSGPVPLSAPLARRQKRVKP